MKRLLAIVVGVSALASARTVNAVPVVPNFTQGSMTSNTETTSTVTETINSMNYDTGYQYVITGTNISHDGTTISAPNTCLLYTSPSPRDRQKSRMPSSA